MIRLTAPIRFVAGILTLWIGVRIALWIPTAPVPDAPHLVPPRLPPPAGAAAAPRTRSAPLVRAAEQHSPPLARRHLPVSRDPHVAPALVSAARQEGAAAIPWAVRRERMRLAAYMPAFAQPMLMRFPRRPPPADTDHHNRAEDRSPWRVDAWLLWRDDGPRALAEGGELGGSQAGLRVQYGLARTRRAEIAATARVSRPLEGPDGGEAAIGLVLRPSPDIPLELTAERRIALERGGRDAWSVGAAAGIYRQPLAHGFELDGYAQAGIVGARRRDAYVDAHVAVARPISIAGRTEFTVGGAAWAAAQPGASRADIGPQAALHVPAGNGGFRLSVSWRQRIAGSASPASGPALSLGADF